MNTLFSDLDIYQSYIMLVYIIQQIFYLYINSASPAYHRHKCTFRFILSMYEIAAYICRSIRVSINY